MPVRTDFVNTLNDILFEIQNTTSTNASSLTASSVATAVDSGSSPSNDTTAEVPTSDEVHSPYILYPYDIPRVKNVVHYWPNKIKGTSISNLQSSLSTHRRKISQTLYELSHSSYYMEQYPHDVIDPNSIYVGFIGKRGKIGRQQPQATYIKHMLNFKVVIVCQKDKWEDHYRLMESLVSGSLVFTDPYINNMLPYKLQNGTNIIVYNSITELKHYIRYYIAEENELERYTIAKNGYHIAMKYHRSYHIINRMIFGNWTSSSSSSSSPYDNIIL